MKVMDQSLWKRLIAQVAIWAMVFQTVISVFGCGPTAGHAGSQDSGPQLSNSPASQGYNLSQKGGVIRAVAICTANGFKRATTNGGAPTGGSDDIPQQDCPVCLTHCCHSGDVTATEAVLLPTLPVVSAVLALEAGQPLLGAELHAVRNRDPPASLLV
jgi:hypothetical protein